MKNQPIFNHALGLTNLSRHNGVCSHPSSFQAGSDRRWEIWNRITRVELKTHCDFGIEFSTDPAGALGRRLPSSDANRLNDDRSRRSHSRISSRISEALTLSVLAHLPINGSFPFNLSFWSEAHVWAAKTKNPAATTRDVSSSAFGTCDKQTVVSIDHEKWRLRL
jgi:hypothetical protein